MNHLHSSPAEEQFSISLPLLQPYSSSSLLPLHLSSVSCSSFMPNPQEMFSLAFSISSSDIFYTSLLLLFLLFHLICIEAASLLCANKMLTSSDFEMYPPYIKWILVIAPLCLLPLLKLYYLLSPTEVEAPNQHGYYFSHSLELETQHIWFLSALVSI